MTNLELSLNGESEHPVAHDMTGELARNAPPPQ